MTIATLIVDLNARRIAAGMKPVKSWKASKQSLIDAINALPPVPETKPTKSTSVASIARQAGIDPKVFRAKFRRHYPNGAPEGATAQSIIDNLAIDRRKK